MATDCPVCGIRIIRGTVICPNTRCQVEITHDPDPSMSPGKAWPGAPWASTKDTDVGDYPCLIQLPPWQGPRGRLIAASSLDYWIQLDEFWFQKGEPRAIHRELVAAYRAYVDVRERAVFQIGYSNPDEVASDGLVDRLLPLTLKRASEKKGVEREDRWPHRLADLPRFEDQPDQPYTVNEISDMNVWRRFRCGRTGPLGTGHSGSWRRPQSSRTPIRA